MRLKAKLLKLTIEQLIKLMKGGALGNYPKIYTLEAETVSLLQLTLNLKLSRYISSIWPAV